MLFCAYDFKLRFKFLTRCVFSEIVRQVYCVKAGKASKVTALGARGASGAGYML